MWKIIRAFVAVFVSVETLFTCMFSGVTPKAVENI